MNKKYLIGLVIGVVAVGLIALGVNSGYFDKTSSTNNKLTVTTSFYPLYFFTSQIAGDKADVTNITPSGSEPHDYEPTTADMISIEKSKLLVLNGGHLEAWGDKFKDQLKGTGTTVVTAGENLTTGIYTDEEGENAIDSHVWLDPRLAKVEATKIEGALEKADPENKSYYQNNLNTLIAKLDQLDQEYKTGLDSCQLKEIITSHAAFGYLAKRYGLTQVAIAGLSPDAEPSPSQLADTAKFAKENNVKYIFFESLVSPKLSQTIASEVGAQTMVLNPIEGLTPDEQKAGNDYLSIMKDNLANLRAALQCK
ncbi:zinc ABC transporter solute-binding protein [Candidatus Saccharibacteria bacterium]|nr:zinc ABC transporter solute-binding protein [Candidatus Saccharibacteria bacterium]